MTLFLILLFILRYPNNPGSDNKLSHAATMNTRSERLGLFAYFDFLF